MKTLGGTVVLGVAILMASTDPAVAQLGSMGDAAEQGAGDAVKQEMMKRATEKAGIPTPGAPAGTPAEAPDTAAVPADEPSAEDADAAAVPAGEPAEAPDAAAAADADAADAPSDEAEPAADAPQDAPAGDEADDPVEGARKMIPKLP